ncbi:MAG: hypothetical protein U0325_28925 [Polyangiales bacterium]
MRYRLTIALLTFGTVAGFASGFASLACHRHHHEARRAPSSGTSPTCA